MQSSRSRSLTATLAAASFGLTALAAVAPNAAFAQTAPAKPLNAVQKHPTMTGMAVGIGTHAALKKSAAWKKAHHQKLSFAERHPTMTGIAAAVATRSAIKHYTPKTHK